MSLEDQIISSFMGETVLFQADGEKYVGVLKNADGVYFIISPYQCVSENQTAEEAVKSLRRGFEPHWRCDPTDYGENMVIPATTTLYIFDPEKLKK